MRRITAPQLVSMMARMPEQIEVAAYEGLVKSAVEVHKTAVAKFGVYQSASGPYPAWALLSINTVTAKQNRGMDGANPLIGVYGSNRYNDIAKATSRSIYPVSLRQSLAMDVRKTELAAFIGTNDPIGEYQEYGTSRGIPPRPFLRPALYERQGFVRESMRLAIGLGLVTWLH